MSHFAHQSRSGSLTDTRSSLQTPVYACYPFQAIATACIFLTCRELQVPLPSSTQHPWWELFDADIDDITSICGYIQRLYRPRTDHERNLIATLVSKREVRRWLEMQEGASGSM